MTRIRPMLAAQKYRAPGDLWGPLHEAIVERHLQEDGYLIVQPKWDGFRCVLHDGIPMSRSGLPLANAALQQFAQDYGAQDQLDTLAGIDCEVFSGHNYHPEVFRDTTSGIRSQGGSGDILMVAYDFAYGGNSFGYTARRDHLRSAFGLREDVPFYIVDAAGRYHVKLVMCPQVEVRTLEELYEAEAHYVGLNFEGAIVRRPNSLYKHGRATALGGELVKVKRRNTYDAVVEGYEEGTQNTNEATTSELGYTKRSSHKGNLIPNGRLGALHVRFVNGPYEGIQQKVGVFRGLTHEDLADLWDDKESLTGRYCELSVDPATGGYDAARCPVWLRWRPKEEF